jgi:two-component system, OmpR family, sensor kinase
MTTVSRAEAPSSTQHLHADGQGATVAIEVRDRGPGIAAADQARIFERFERAVPDGNKMSGFGLGLYIARELARAHGGDLTLRSAPGAGATFVLTLPAAT